MRVATTQTNPGRRPHTVPHFGAYRGTRAKLELWRRHYASLDTHVKMVGKNN